MENFQVKNVLTEALTNRFLELGEKRNSLTPDEIKEYMDLYYEITVANNQLMDELNSKFNDLINDQEILLGKISEMSDQNKALETTLEESEFWIKVYRLFLFENGLIEEYGKWLKTKNEG
ncbi:hypothetical protein [Ammoniphilus resinae]|uniref:Uncharacterized protein n=1 Tax=Ammoniphilus resinae TaxID=861532 RepID=A0ABS4GX65_9BACL|nr:hypothetical protein [Ammoniphilus resinae]MBP1934862.1 hypothetical protein [Ammoniphilus resinae]